MRVCWKDLALERWSNSRCRVSGTVAVAVENLEKEEVEDSFEDCTCMNPQPGVGAVHILVTAAVEMVEGVGNTAELEVEETVVAGVQHLATWAAKLKMLVEEGSLAVVVLEA